MAAGDSYKSNHVAEGQVAGTGAALTVICGFRPRVVRIINRTQNSSLEFTGTMPDASGAKTVSAGTRTFVTSNGITPLFNGFQLGADSGINASSDVIYWQALK